MAPKRRIGVAEAASPPPVWMIKEAARAALQKSVEELGKVRHSPRPRGSSPVSTPKSGGSLLSVAMANAPRNFCHHCGRPCAPTAHFCATCGQNLGTPSSSAQHMEGCTSQNRKRQRKSKAQIWHCVYQHGVDIRQFPSVMAPRTAFALEAGQEFGVEQEEMGGDGILYLKLADGRGWVFEQKPSLGVICMKGQAQPGKLPGKPQKTLRMASPITCRTPKQASQNKGRNQSRKASPKKGAAKPPDNEKVPGSAARGRSPSAKEKASPLPRCLAYSLDKASPKMPFKAVETEKAPASERRGRSPMIKEKASPKPLAQVVEIDKAPTSARRGRSPATKDKVPTNPKILTGSMDKAPAKIRAASMNKEKATPRQPAKDLKKAPSSERKAAKDKEVPSPRRTRSPLRKAATRPAPRNRLEDTVSALKEPALPAPRTVEKGKPLDSRGKTPAPAKLLQDARARSRTCPPLNRLEGSQPAALGPAVPNNEVTRPPQASLLGRLLRANQDAVSTPLQMTLPKSPRLKRPAREVPAAPEKEPAEASSVPSRNASLLSKKTPRTARDVPEEKQKDNEKGLAGPLRKAPSKPLKPARASCDVRDETEKTAEKAAAPAAAAAAASDEAPPSTTKPAVAVSDGSEESEKSDEQVEPELTRSDASETSSLNAELFAQEEQASRQFHQMETSAKNAWQQAKDVAEALVAQKEEANQAEARKRLAKMAAGRQAVEARAAEVETSLESLRREIAQVEQDSQLRTEALRDEAEAAKKENDACLLEALATAQGAKEDAERQLQSLQQRRSAELRLAKEKYADDHEALLQSFADHQLKAQGPVLELEARAEAQRQAAAAEARVQEAAAPQLAALKSEVVEAERRASAAEEARKRSEERALAEEARLKALLDLLPQAEADAARESRELVAEANRAAKKHIAEATAASEAAACTAEERIASAQGLLASERVSTQEAIERHLAAAADAQRQAEEAAVEAEEAAAEAEEQRAKALKESSEAYAAAKGDAAARLSQAQSQRRDTEKQVAENIANLRAEHSRKVLVATRASEEAAQNAKKHVEALKAKFHANHTEMNAKVKNAECTVHRAETDLEETKKWSSEIRAKMRGLVEESQRQLQEQELSSCEQLEAEQAAAKERLEAAQVLCEETQALAEAAEQDSRARREVAREASDRAAGSAERRRTEAVAAVAEQEIAAAAETEAMEVEAEENFEALSVKVRRAWASCKQQQLEAHRQMTAAQEAAHQEVIQMTSRLEEVRKLAEAADVEAKEAAKREAEASQQLQAEEFRVLAARAELSAAERSLDCSVAQCEELAAAAELDAQEKLEAFQEVCEERARDDEEQAEAVEQLAEAEETRALAAEEAAVFEDLSFQGTLEKERRRIQDEIDRALQRTVEVETAIQQAVSYSEKSTRELLKYMEKVVRYAGEPVESVTSSPIEQDNLCSHCHAEASPDATCCKNCGHNLQSAPAISDVGSPMHGKLRRPQRHLKGSPMQHMRNMGPPKTKKSLKW